MRTPDPRVPITLACLAAATLLTAPAAAAATPVPPQILAGPGLATSAVDISPLGVVAGMSGPAEPFPGDPAQEARPFRWTPRLDGTYRRQALPVPADAAGAGVAGVTAAGAVGGFVAAAETITATRWPVLGGTPQSVAAAPSKVAAVGPAQLLVEVPPPGSGFGGGLELVRADGTRADVDAVVPDAQFVRGFFGTSVGGPDAVSFGVFGGAGQGSFVEPWVWVDGAGTPLPVRSTFFFGPACVSEILSDGTQAYSGLIFEERRFVVGVHRGGVPGTEVELPVPEGEFGRLTCDYGTDAMHADGTVVGSVADDGAVWRGEVLTRIAPDAGETSVRAAAVASRGRVLIVAGGADGTYQPYLWRDGERRALQLPAGTALRDVVEFTDTGLVLANVTGAGGAVQTVVWRT